MNNVDVKGNTLYKSDVIECEGSFYKISFFEDGDIVTECGMIIKQGTQVSLYSRNFDKGDVVRVVELEEGSGDDDYVMIGECYPVFQSGYPLIDISLPCGNTWLIHVSQVELVSKAKDSDKHIYIKENTVSKEFENFLNYLSSNKHVDENPYTPNIDNIPYHPHGVKEDIEYVDEQVMYYGDYEMDGIVVDGDKITEYDVSSKQVVIDFIEEMKNVK